MHSMNLLKTSSGLIYKLNTYINLIKMSHETYCRCLIISVG